jgi:hypothetical protein
MHACYADTATPLMSLHMVATATMQLVAAVQSPFLHKGKGLSNASQAQ